MAFFDEEGNAARERYSEALAHIMLRWKDPVTHQELKPGHPFFHTFANSLRYTETEGFDRPLGGKDPLALAAVGFTAHSPVGKLFINPRNFLNLNIRQAAGLIVHEILHIVYDHLHYEQARSHPKIWNIATDCTINQQVLAMNYHLPEGKGILEEDMDHEVKGITPETLATMLKCQAPEPDQHAMFYFKWLLDKLGEIEDKLKKQKPQKCQSCAGTGKQPKKQQDSQCEVHPKGPEPKPGDSKNTLPEKDLADLAKQLEKQNKNGQDSQSSKQEQDQSNQDGSSGEDVHAAGESGNSGETGSEQGQDSGDQGSESGDSGQGSSGQSGSKGSGESASGSEGQAEAGDNGSGEGGHEHGQSGPQCTCKDHSKSGQDSGKGDGSESGSGDGDGAEGEGDGGSGSGSGSGQSEPCDCCNGTGNQPGSGAGGIQDLLDELNGMTNHKHWDDLTPEEKEVIRRFEAQAAQNAKAHHDGMSGLPGDIAGAIGNKIKALEAEIDLNCRSIKTV